MKIKMLRSCSVGGAHYQDGQTYSLPDSVARQLVALRSAAITEEQSPPLRETRAERPPQADTKPGVNIDDARKMRGRRR